MPLFYQHHINDTTQLAVWSITEDEDFFLQKVNIQSAISHPRKRLQHLAGRYLLRLLNPDFPLHLIEIAESKKPLLSNGECDFSISHCGDYAAVIVSHKPVGIDVELITPRVELVKHKFLSAEEIQILQRFTGTSIEEHKLLTLFWSTKEAIFKWYGKGKVDFRENMIIDQLFFANDRGWIKAHFFKNVKINLQVEFKFFGKLCLAWIVP